MDEGTWFCSRASCRQGLALSPGKGLPAAFDSSSLKGNKRTTLAQPLSSFSSYLSRLPRVWQWPHGAPRPLIRMRVFISPARPAFPTRKRGRLAVRICRTTRQVDIWRGLSTLRFTCAKSSLVLWTCKYVITCTVCVCVTTCPWH